MTETALETVDRFNEAWGAHDLVAEKLPYVKG